MAKKVVTDEVRLSWPELFEAKVAPGATVPKFSVMLLIPKTDKKTVKALFDAEKATAEEQKDKFGGKVPAKLRSIIRGGDGEDDDGEVWSERFPERQCPIVLYVSVCERNYCGEVT